MIPSREVYQCLRDAALGLAPLLRIDAQVVQVDGWQLALLCDDEGLACCTHATSPDGRTASQADWPRYGTNPVDHMSLWERRQIEQLLACQRRFDEIQPVLAEEHLRLDDAGRRTE